MNPKQRTLTYAFLAIFALSILFVPWDFPETRGYTATTKFGPLFFPPSLGPWAERHIASSVLYFWASLLVFYFGLFFAWKTPDAASAELPHGTRNA